MWLSHRRTVLVGARRVSRPYRRLVRQRGACAGLPRTGGHNGHHRARNPECVSALYTLVAYAAVLELGQLFIPGRHAAFGDFMASSLGAITGVALTTFAMRRAARV